MALHAFAKNADNHQQGEQYSHTDEDESGALFRWYSRYRHSGDWSRHRAQLVALTAHGSHVTRSPAVIAKGLPQQFDALGHGLLTDYGRCPHGLNQRVERHHSITLCNQIGKQSKTQSGNIEALAAAFDRLTFEVDLQVIKFEAAFG